MSDANGALEKWHKSVKISAVNADILLEAAAVAVVNAENSKNVKSGIASPDISPHYNLWCHNLQVVEELDGQRLSRCFTKEKKKESVRDMLM